MKAYNVLFWKIKKSEIQCPQGWIGFKGYGASFDSTKCGHFISVHVHIQAESFFMAIQKQWGKGGLVADLQ